MTREVRLTPSILNADRNNIMAEIERISSASDLIHLDIMDDIFVPNMTWNFDAASKIISRASIGVDAHLMVADVDKVALNYAAAGCASVTVHVEASRDIRETLKGIRKLGSRASFAVKPNTPIEDYFSYLDDADMVLIMTVEPGFGGQSFMDSMLSKIQATRLQIGDRPIWLQVDGGISLSTIERAAEAGADTFVAGSAVFSAENPADMVKQLRELAQQV